MRKITLALGALMGALAMIAVTAHAATQEPNEKFKRLTVDEVDAMVKAKSINVFDCNGPERFKKGHVPTAKPYSIADEKPQGLPADKSAPLVFYCGNTHCMACHQGADQAIAAGYTNVSIMPEGIAGWEKAGKSVEK
jgi:rhodanese-related sulfurtransferase